MSPTGIVAWWGAILSTIVFLWDVYKFRTAGAKLRFSVRTGMQSINVPSFDGKTSFKPKRRITVSDLPRLQILACTISRIDGHGLACGIVLPRPQSYLIQTQAQPFPCELKPGAVWRGLTEQVPQIEEWARKGILYFDLYHSHSEKPIRRRVVIRRQTPSTKKTAKAT